MIACQLPHLAGKTSVPIRKKNLCFTEITRIEQYLTWGRIAGVIFVSDAHLQVTQWNPGGFSAPTCLDDFVAEWQQLVECGAALRRCLFFHLRYEFKRTNYDMKVAHCKTFSFY